MLLRVPPASIKALGELGTACAKRGVPYNAAVTKISFDLASATPKLLFKPVGLLDDATFAAVQEVANSDIVKNITGNGFSSEPAPELAAPKVEPQEEEAPAPKPVAKAKPKAEAVEEEVKPKAKPVDVDLGDLNLDDLNFDD
jgi:outer membrane biosynthesis protein TonB